MADDPVVIRIRELSRTEESFSGDLNRAVNQLYQLLLRYYPQLLQLCAHPDEPWLWALLELAPTPQRGARIAVSRLRQLLSKHRIRRWTAEQVQEILTGPALPLSPGTAEAISEHALLLLPQLRVMHTQRKQVADQMQNVLDEMETSAADNADSHQHRDITLLLSLPGVGRVVTGIIIAEGFGSFAGT